MMKRALFQCHQGRQRATSRRCFCDPRLRSRRWYHELSYASHGDPTDVLTYEKAAPVVVSDTLDDARTPSALLKDNAIRMEMWYAPLNPADINTIQGKYPSPYSDKANDEQRAAADLIRGSPLESDRTVAGSEGWGHVTHVVGEHTNGIQVGDAVVVGQPGLGTFRSSFWTLPTSVIRLKHGHELKELLGSQAATIPQLGGTALRMLRDFVMLQPGDVVVQNAGNSGVAFLASQLAQTLLGVSVVSLARRGERSATQWKELVHHLTTDGKCVKVVAEEDLSNRDAIYEFQAELKGLSRTGRQLPSLALNSVGGESASILCKCLEKGGTLVTYGGMSMKPVTIATPQLIFRNLRAFGYWHSRWMIENSSQARQLLVDELADAILGEQVVCPPVVDFPLSQVHEALIYNHNESAIRRKVVFRCEE